MKKRLMLINNKQSSWRWFLLVLSCACTMLLLAACGDSPTQIQPTSTSQPVTITSPTPTSISSSISVSYPQIAYDGKTHTLLAFGGRGATQDVNSTWSWDGTTWTLLHPSVSPPGREAGSMVYDAATGQIVLFGGYDGYASNTTQPLLNDTWTWDGTTWTQQHPTVSPPARFEASMAYDATTQTVVLFGGGGGGTPPAGLAPNMAPPLNDTWVWDGTTWTQQRSTHSPAAREDASMAYDAAMQAVVLFGGNDGISHTPDLTDTWTWNGATWMLQHPANSPTTRFTYESATMYMESPAMSYDATTRQVILTFPVTNDSGSQKMLSSWLWNGHTWLQQPFSPIDEDEIQPFYNPDRQTLFAFVSSGSIDNILTWTGKGWQ
jgi:hypothetical protein